MKTPSRTFAILAAAGALTSAALVAPRAVAGDPVTAAFTYQGELIQSGLPVTGLADFQFTLFDSATGGAQIGNTIEGLNIPLTNGLFTATLDFGNQFNGQQRFLEIAVRRPAGSGSFVILSPRQSLTAAPYATFALNGGGGGAQGPQGPQGASGPQGADGPQGAAGANGAQGATGAQGAAGTQGAQGPQGIQGNPGNTGSQGAQGPQGIQGNPGNTGSQGAQGPQGATGAQGSQGIQGVPGNTGSQGAQGPQGAQGAQGAAGSAGAVVGSGTGNTAAGTNAVAVGGSNNSAAGATSHAAGNRAKANHAGVFVWGDSTNADITSTGVNQFLARAAGGAVFFSNAAMSQGVQLAAGGGSWASVSDRAVKENIKAVDAQAVLDRVVAMPIAEWNYISQDPTIRHIGPMAQDFHAAFGVGEDNRHITSIDADGVALAAIKGLNEKVEAKDAHIADLEARIKALETSLRRIADQKVGGQ